MTDRASLDAESIVGSLPVCTRRRDAGLNQASRTKLGPAPVSTTVNF